MAILPKDIPGHRDFTLYNRKKLKWKAEIKQGRASAKTQYQIITIKITKLTTPSVGSTLVDLFNSWLLGAGGTLATTGHPTLVQLGDDRITHFLQLFQLMLVLFFLSQLIVLQPG